MHLPDIFFIQTAGYREDFNEERKDREKTQSKMADMEMQYKHQGKELMVSRQHCEQLERRLKEVESYYRSQLSQTKYSTGDKNRTISKLQAENKRLEVRVKIPSIRLFWPNK